MDKLTILRWVSRVIAILNILFWIVFLTIEGWDKYLLPGILLVLSLIVITFIGWLNEIVGGGLFIILALVYLIVIQGKDLSGMYFYALIPLSSSGILHLLTYFYSEKKEMEEDDF